MHTRLTPACLRCPTFSLHRELRITKGYGPSRTQAPKPIKKGIPKIFTQAVESPYVRNPYVRNGPSSRTDACAEKDSESTPTPSHTRLRLRAESSTLPSLFQLRTPIDKLDPRLSVARRAVLAPLSQPVSPVCHSHTITALTSPFSHPPSNRRPALDIN